MPRRLTLAALALGAGAACAAPPPPPPPPPASAPAPAAGGAHGPDSAAAELVATTGLVRAELRTVLAVLDPYLPRTAIRYRLRWWYQTRRGTTSGRGTVTIGPPDSLRFDFRAPLGRRGSVGLVGDRVSWAQPDSLATVIAGRVPLLWAALGVPRPVGDSTFRKREPSRAIVRFARADTLLTYTITAGAVRQMTAVIAVGGRVLGSSLLQEDSLARGRGTGLMRLTAPDLVLRFAVERTDTVRTLAHAWFAVPEE